MLSTEPKLAQCQKCGKYVFQSDVNGFRVIVDPAPVPEPALIAFLTMGHTLYVGSNWADGRLRVLAPSTTLDGPRYVSHGCASAGHTARASNVEVAPVGPQQAPAMPGSSLDGCHPLTAPASGSQGHTALPDLQFRRAGNTVSWRNRPSPVESAIPHRSRYVKPTRCDTCNKIIEVDTPDAFSIEYEGRLVYGQHVEC